MGKEITATDLTIMIGHSFGARILYTATSQVLIDEVQRRHPGNKESSYGVMTGPADLILLLNAAFEASVFTAMHSVRRPDSKGWERINDRQQPLLLAIATENDWETGTAFPLGQILEYGIRLSDWFHREVEDPPLPTEQSQSTEHSGAVIDRRNRQLLTLGNYKKYITHSLEAVMPSDGSPASTDFWYDRFETAGLVLLRKADRQPGNPFLVARTTANIISGHNGIWGKELRSWLIGFLLDLHKRRAAAEGQNRYPARSQPSFVH